MVGKPASRGPEFAGWALATVLAATLPVSVASLSQDRAKAPVPAILALLNQPDQVAIVSQCAHRLMTDADLRALADLTVFA